jgi:AbrB family looped-hinge helix DNA binding protein
MRTAKVLAKGQVVIPKEIWVKIGIGPGDRVELKLVKEGVVLIPVKKNATEKFRGIITGRLTLNELEALHAEESERL